MGSIGAGRSNGTLSGDSRPKRTWGTGRRWPATRSSAWCPLAATTASSYAAVSNPAGIPERWPWQQPPRVLVFSTNGISDPGIDLAGSLHMHYSPEVVVISLPCTSAIRPSWILYALEQGFDGVFIASDGEECAYLSDCAKRSAQIMDQAQDLLAEHGIRRSTPQDGRDLLGLRRVVY